MKTSQRMGFALVALLLIAPGARAQEASPTPGEKTRPSSSNKSYNLPGGYTGKKSDVVKTIKIMAVVQAVDLEARKVTVVPEKADHRFRIAVLKEPLEWGLLDKMDVVFFGQPSGMERIKVGKKAAKASGKKSMRLEDLEVGSVLKADIYPRRRDAEFWVAAREVTVERLAK